MYVRFDSHGIGLCAITQRDESHKDNTEGNASKPSVGKGKKNFHRRTPAYITFNTNNFVYPKL
jgi:hypothetical protein